ncbi:hypothetical protein [Marinobacterium rhizophilum]|uniref:Uncharacterized protein n=1 Tax=Marinobacterium rhizophilum TaxID=420402 RepID=A0ABY5HJZ9_9GAMM|nr:hypothetical protein [Marinobacterium rhizophilum]UTW11913.1 hypothetical protein KDW95_22170 [Marinobacterium rhizophilum]
MPNLYACCIAIGLCVSGLLYFNLPEGLVGIYQPFNEADSVERAYAQQRADVEAMQQGLLEDASQDPTEVLEATAAGAPSYECDNYHIVVINNRRFAKQLTDTGIIYTIFPGSTPTFGKVDVESGLIRHVARETLPQAVSGKLESFLPTLEGCRNASMAGMTQSPYLLSDDLLELLERGR